jgi:UDP-N-acetylmuramyl pentapeptide synthase
LPIDFKYIKDWNSILANLVFDGKIIKTNILWSENFAYIQLAYLMLEDLWVRFDKLDEILIMENQAGRFNIFTWINNSILVDSSYNAGPESMKKMIDNVVILRKRLYPDYKLWFVIWDMRELWKFSEDSHKQLFIDLKSNDLLISVWKETSKYFDEATHKFLSSKEAWIFLKEKLLNSDDKYIVLFKWSQNTIFVEEALKQVLLDGNDEKKLVRQDKVWMNKKNKFFYKVKK